MHVSSAVFDCEMNRLNFDKFRHIKGSGIIGMQAEHLKSSPLFFKLLYASNIQQKQCSNSNFDTLIYFALYYVEKYNIISS